MWYHWFMPTAPVSAAGHPLVSGLVGVERHVLSNSGKRTIWPAYSFSSFSRSREFGPPVDVMYCHDGIAMSNVGGSSTWQMISAVPVPVHPGVCVRYDQSTQPTLPGLPPHNGM